MTERRAVVFLGNGGFDQPVGTLWLRRRGGRETASFRYARE